MNSEEKKATLLQEFELQGESSSRKPTSHWAVLFCLLAIFGVLFAAAFVGGFFLGKNQTDSSCNTGTKNESPRLSQQPPQRQSSPKAFLVEYGGSQEVIPAYNGDEPIEDFMQCRSVLSNGKMLCSPSNPLLTPKGIVQLLIYQHGDDVSLVLTGTGTNYGEQVVNASMTGESQVTVNAGNFNGLLVQFADSYNTLYRTVPIPGQLAIDMNWGNVRSIGFALSLSNASGVDGTISFKSTSSIPFNIRGAFMHDTEIPALPESSTPLSIKAHIGNTPDEVEPDAMIESPLFTDDEVLKSGFQILFMEPQNRRRRSFALSPHVPAGALGFLSKDPATGVLNHRVEFHHESRQGGKNGTVCWHVKNFIARIEAHACYLFHDALYDGMEEGSEPNDKYTRNHMVTTLHYRNMGDEKWNQTTIRQMDMMTSDILKDLRQKRSFFSHLWSGIKNVAHHVVDGVKTAFHAVENGVKTAVTKVVSVAKKVGTAIWNEGKKVVAKCGGIISTVEKAGECIGSGVGCVGGIAGEVPSGGADTLGTVKSCVGAVSHCASFGKCF